LLVKNLQYPGKDPNHPSESGGRRDEYDELARSSSSGGVSFGKPYDQADKSQKEEHVRQLY
jgi:hypothetical protein